MGTPGDPAIKNVWGTFLNTNDNLLDDAVTGVASVGIGGLTTYTLTVASGASDQSRPLVQQYTGALTADCTVTMTNVRKIGWAINSTTGARNVILTTGVGTTATIPPDGRWWFYSSDGATNVALISAGFSSISLITGLTLGGTLTVTSGGASITGAVTVAGAVAVTGAITASTSVTAPTFFANNAVSALSIKDFGGTYRNTIYTGTDNYTNIINGAGTGVRILNQAASVALFTMTDAGAATVTGTLNVSSTLSQGGVAAVLNNGATWGISISGTAAAVPWSGITGLPYAFNQSTDINASPTFNQMFANGLVAVGNATTLSGNSYYITSGGSAIGPWGPVGVGIQSVNAITAVQFFTTSDRRSKTDIEDISVAEAWAWIGAARSVKFTLNGARSSGFIAQEDATNLRSRAVYDVPDTRSAFAETDGIVPSGHRLVRDYLQDIAYLTTALQDALARIEALEKGR